MSESELNSEDNEIIFFYIICRYHFCYWNGIMQ